MLPSTAALTLGLISAAQAQVVPLSEDQVLPPWIAQQIFGLSALPDLSDPDTRDSTEPEDTPVKTRQQPGYEPVGIRAGSWMLNPSLTAGGFYDSNVLSSSATTRGDMAAVVEPALRVHTLWERHGIDLKMFARSTSYRDQSSLDTVDGGIKGSGWISISPDIAVLASFQASRLSEGVGTPSSPSGAVEPTPYTYVAGDLTVRRQFNRLATAIGFGVDSYDFGSARAQNGSIINQDRRDGQIYTLHGRTDYALSPRFGWFNALEVNKRRLTGSPSLSLDSDGYRALTGFTAEFTHLITGEIGAGYIRQKFDDPSIGTIEGSAYRALVTWHTTRMLDVHFRAEQIVTQTSDTSATGVMATAFQVGADYELRRNLVLSIAGGREHDRFHGMARADNVTTVATQLKYLMNRFFSVGLSHKYISRDSNVPSASFDKHQVGINVTAQF